MLENDSCRKLMSAFAKASGAEVYADSVRVSGGVCAFMARMPVGEQEERGLATVLVVLGESNPGFSGRKLDTPEGETLVCSLSPENASVLREAFPALKPVALGSRPAFGCGDRIGLAAPGHIRACIQRQVTPILAQQSARELERTNRTPRQVMDAATWGVFQTGREIEFGSDADHLKQEADVDSYAAAGFTMYTIDPSDFVQDEAANMPASELDAAFAELPDSERYEREYAGKDLSAGKGADAVSIRMESDPLKRAAVTYGRAILRVKELYEHLKKTMGGADFDVEVSVDETSTPTTPEAHLLVAMELERMGVPVHSLALRFVGEFQKAIDYRGDLVEFERQLALHAGIARGFGYKISVHSGSDKFAVYPVLGKLAPSLCHVKTAGTSYLEAVRLIARRDAALFREILKLAFERFAQDRASYHVTTDLDRIRPPDDLEDAQLPSLLDQDDSRQLLHITYGSVLTAADESGSLLLAPGFMDVLNRYEAEHYELLATHIGRHLDLLGDAVRT